MTDDSLATGHRAILDEIRSDVGDIRPRVLDIQLGEAMQFLEPKRSPSDALRRQQSLTRRNSLRWSAHSTDMIQLVTSIGDWIESPEPSLLILHAGPRAETHAKEIVVELITLLHPAAKQLCWYLSDATVEGSHATLAKVLKSLASQLIALDTSAMTKNLGDNISSTKLHGYHTPEEWADLIILILKNLRGCFIIVEAEDVHKLIKGDSGQLSQFMAIFQGIVDKALDAGCKCRVLVVGYGSVRGDPGSARHPARSCSKTVSLRAPSPVPARLRRGRPTSPYESPAWQALKRKAR